MYGKKMNQSKQSMISTQNYKQKNSTFCLILGPMFASKSTELIRIANRYNSIGIPILAINHSWNQRYGTTEICSHDLTKLSPSISISKLMDIFKYESWKQKYEEAELIFIEEIQFFDDAYEFVLQAMDQDKKGIVAAGLSGDYLRQPFVSIPKLIPLATEIIHLTALCKLCGNGKSASYTLRFIQDKKDQTSVGAGEQYMPVCHDHYLIEMERMEKNKEQESIEKK